MAATVDGRMSAESPGSTGPNTFIVPIPAGSFYCGNYVFFAAASVRGTHPTKTPHTTYAM